MVSTRNSIAAKLSPEQETAKSTPVKKERTRAAKVAKDGEQSTPGKAADVEAKLKSKRAKRRARATARLKAAGLPTRKPSGKPAAIEEQGKNDES